MDGNTAFLAKSLYFTNSAFCAYSVQLSLKPLSEGMLKTNEFQQWHPFPSSSLKNIISVCITKHPNSLPFWLSPKYNGIPRIATRQRKLRQKGTTYKNNLVTKVENMWSNDVSNTSSSYTTMVKHRSERVKIYLGDKLFTPLTDKNHK
jgi:hypothetical protein